MNRFFLAAILLGVFAMSAAAPASPEGPPPASRSARTALLSKLAAERAAELKTDLKKFTLSLNYHGQQDKPYYHLLLSVPRIPGQDRANPFYLTAQITEEQAITLIDHLALSGFFDNAQPAKERKAPEGPTYELSVNSRYVQSLGFDGKMLERLDQLEKVFEDDAAAKMKILLARLSGHRKDWTSGVIIGK